MAENRDAEPPAGDDEGRADAPEDRRDGGSKNTADEAKDDESKENESKDDSKEDDSKDDESKEDDSGDEDEDKDKKPSLLKKPWVRITLIVAAIIGVIAFIFWLISYLTHGRYQQSTNDAYIEADQVTIASRVSGYVTAVLVDDNQDVRAGQKLVTIESDNYSANLGKDRANIAEAQAKVAEVLAQIHQQRAKIGQASAQLTEDRAQVTKRNAAYAFDGSQAARYTPLAAIGAETKEKAAQYRSQARQSAAELKSSRDKAAGSFADLVYQRRQIEVLRAQLASARARVAEQEAQFASDKVDYDATSITSRIAGRVGNRTVRTGQYVQSGTRMLTVVPIESMYVKANFKETQIGLMRVGQPATITADALAGDTLHGTIVSFSPGTGAQFSLVPKDNSTGNFTKIVQRVPVKIRIDAGREARRILVPGLSVVVSIDTTGAKDDKRAQKDESEQNKDRRKQQDKAQTDQDRKSHTRGAGRE